MTDLRFPRVAALKTADALRRHLTTNGITLEFDDTLTSPESSPLAAPLTVEGVHHRQPLLHPAHGRMGRNDRRPAERPDDPPLETFRLERRQADLGRRSRRHLSRGASESESARARRSHRTIDCRLTGGARVGAPRSVRTGRRRRPLHRSAVDAFGPLRPACFKARRRRSPPMRIHSSTPAFLAASTY